MSCTHKVSIQILIGIWKTSKKWKKDDKNDGTITPNHMHIFRPWQKTCKFKKVWYKTVKGVAPASYPCHHVTTKKKTKLKKAKSWKKIMAGYPQTTCTSSDHVQYGSGKRTNFFFHFADQFYNPLFFAEWFGVNHPEWKSFTRSYALDIPRTFSGPQCTHDIRSVCEYLRVAIDYSVQESLTTQIILSNDENQTKIVTTANTINTL